MLDTLITSKTRIKLLVKFFLNPESRSYLRSLATEFGESTNAIRLELNKFEEAHLLSSELNGNRKYYSANQEHPLFGDINKLVSRHLGITTIVERLVKKLGNLREVYLTGDLARGIESKIVDLIIVGDEINRDFLLEAIEKTERLLQTKIRYLIYTCDEFQEQSLRNPILLLWKNEVENGEWT